MSSATQLEIRASAVSCNDLVELLQHWATRRPLTRAFTFLGDDEREQDLSYAELDRKAQRLAGYLQEKTRAGDRALLLFPPGLEFIEAFFGCLYAGVVPVPTCYPKPNRPSPRLTSIAQDAGGSVLLSTSGTLAQMKRATADDAWSDIPWVGVNAIDATWSECWQRPSIARDDVAFLQYTSGSTSDPKGVMVSHGNLLDNLEAIRRGFHIDVDDEGGADSRGVFWLPAYHDMGLIGGILTPLYVGGHSYLMSPRLFLQRPLRWLSAIDRTRGTISGAPNFAFDLCVDKISPQQRQQLDLSCWNVAFCGAEPIRAESLERFAEAFQESGFRSDTFYPCYGLAESTLLVAGGRGPGKIVVEEVYREALANHTVLRRNGRVGEDIQRLVGCGLAAHGQTIEIVDPETHTACAGGTVGEIWVKGPSNALGYWNRPDDTRQIFAAHLADTGDGPFLRTGDLGFVQDEQLYVTGRLKDMIIIRGRNHYPQDIEWAVSRSHQALRFNGGGAFSVDASDGEALIVVHEVTREHRNANFEQVVRAIRRALVEEHEIDPRAIVLLRPGGLPVTTSGKVQRGLCRQQYLDDQLKELFCWKNPAFAAQANGNGASSAADGSKPHHNTPRPSLAGGVDRVSERIEAWLLSWLVDKAGVASGEISRERPFAEYGIDSLTAVELSHELEAWLGLELTPVLAWNYPTPARLAEYLAREVVGEQPGPSPDAAALGGTRTVAEFERILTEIEYMSEPEVEKQLAARRHRRKVRATHDRSFHPPK